MSKLEWGEMIDFNLKAFIDVANELVRADEVERALWVLDNLPGYYRDYIPPDVLNLKNEILAKLGTPTAYCDHGIYLNINQELAESMEKTMRGLLIVKEVKWLNQNNFTPHVIDYGPGEYWLPMLLNGRGCEYTYEPVYLGEVTYQKALPIFQDKLRRRGEFDLNQPRIFYACEIIEHLWQPSDIKSDMLRNGGMCDVIHISTPRYCFGQTCKDWKKEKQELGHLRTYTPTEFYHTLDCIFPEYHHFRYLSEILHVRLTSKFTQFDLLKEMALKDFLVESEKL